MTSAALLGILMPNTIGYHYVRSAYGLWLPGDGRGSWSEAWDRQVGFVEPHTLHAADPVRHRMAEERRKHPAVPWTAQMQSALRATIERCAAASEWDVAAVGIAPTHLHLALTYTTTDIDGTAKWLGQQMAKAVHANTAHAGPVFCKGHWLQFIYEPDHWARLLAYINAHNNDAEAIGGSPDEIDAFIREIDGWVDRG